MSDSRQRGPRAVWYHWRMHDDFDACYRAVASRDARFDGRFLTGVTSTGIYCRPVCPARTPARRNVRFFACAAAAQEAGFRACRRCRPETAPHAPGWDARADLLGRALRLVNEGVVDDVGVRGLAARVAVSERHLHRLFTTELGASPLAVARTRRAQVARRLLDATDLPVTEVAFCAGYASVRQFNASIRAAYGATPTELRRLGAATTGGAATLSLRLRLHEPFDGAALLAFLRARAIAGVEEVTGGRYRRTVPAGVIDVEVPGVGARLPALRLQARLHDAGDVAAVVRGVRDLWDLDTDPAAAWAVLGEDPVLAPLVAARPGLRVPGTADRFELAVRAVLGQQVSVERATGLAERLVRRHGERLDQADGGLTHRFPSPAALAAADLSGLGVPGARARAVQSLARAVAGGTLSLDGAAGAEAAERLLALPGIGPWTAGYIAMRALRDPDALPVGDLGLRRALAALTDEPLAERAGRWRPWRAYAALQLWTAPTAPRAAA